MTPEQAERNLLDIYNDLNVTRFQGKLPEKPLIKISWETRGASASFKNLSPFVSIYVSPFCEPDRYGRTMMHEMCHFFCDDHGEMFRKKLAEVAEGEAWLNDELKRCEEWFMRDRIQSKWPHAASRLAEKYPGISWVEARKRVAREMGCKVGDVRDVAYDFKDFWATQVRLLKKEQGGRITKSKKGG